MQIDSLIVVTINDQMMNLFGCWYHDVVINKAAWQLRYDRRHNFEPAMHY